MTKVTWPTLLHLSGYKSDTYLYSNLRTTISTFPKYFDIILYCGSVLAPKTKQNFLVAFPPAIVNFFRRRVRILFSVEITGRTRIPHIVNLIFDNSIHSEKPS